MTRAAEPAAKYISLVWTPRWGRYARGGEEHRRGQGSLLQVENQGFMKYRDSIATCIATRSRHELRLTRDTR
jgi:hypothetical protein